MQSRGRSAEMSREEAFLRLIEPGLALTTLLCSTEQSTVRPENPLEAPVLSLVQKEIPADTLRAALDAQRQAAVNRALLVRSLLQMANSLTLVSSRHDVLRFVARALRASGRHYLDGLEGCGPAMSAVLRALYSRVIDWASSVIGNQSTDSGLRAMALSALAPVLPAPLDVPLMLRSNVLEPLRASARGAVSLWQASRAAFGPLTIPSTAQLIAPSVNLTRTTGYVVSFC